VVRPRTTRGRPAETGDDGERRRSRFRQPARIATQRERPRSGEDL